MKEKILLLILDELNLNGYIEAQISEQLVLNSKCLNEDDVKTSNFVLEQLNHRATTIRKLKGELDRKST